MLIWLHFSMETIVGVIGFMYSLGQDGSCGKVFLSNLLDPLLIRFPWPVLCPTPCKPSHLGFYTFPTHRNKA